MGRPRKPLQMPEGRADALRDALAGFSGEQLRAIMRREINFTFRLSKHDRETLDQMAKALNISGGEYLIRLHGLAYETLRRDRPELFAKTPVVKTPGKGARQASGRQAADARRGRRKPLEP